MLRTANAQFAYSKYWFRSRTATIVEIRCEDGVVGYGEGFGPPPVVTATVANVYAPILLGRDPLDR